MSLAEELIQLEALRDRGVLTPDEFSQAKRRLLDGTAPPAMGGDAAAVVNRFRRSRSDKWIGGICGGLAVITGVESWIWRLLISVLFVFGGTGLVIYVLLWIFVPEE